ncbi:CORIN [Mytilus coruscus]|uniref:CORIN n=1 Tax=Mytilus coruscus TaxID=42192 RepID=A0A6J8CFS3_MYTCO|nr:CORIN [Mytilus coruscus]
MYVIALMDRWSCSDGHALMGRMNKTVVRYFNCSVDNLCIPQEYVCDRQWACSDGQDEQNCDEQNCGKILTCVDNLRSMYVIDSGHALMDKMNKTVVRYFNCSVDNLCIPQEYVCDRQWACSDGQDEQNCGKSGWITFVYLRSMYVIDSGHALMGRMNKTVVRYFNCSMDNLCIPQEYVCDRQWACSDGQDEQNCDYSISCTFEEEHMCEYHTGSWIKRSSVIDPEFYLEDHTFHNSSHTGSFMYTGDLNGLYYDKEMTSPYLQTNKPMCVEFFYIVIRPHEYSSVILTVHQNTSNMNNEVFSLVEYRTDVNLQWQRGEFPVAAGVFSLRFTAGGHRSVVAIDDVLLYNGSCAEVNFTTPDIWQTTDMTEAGLETTAKYQHEPTTEIEPENGPTTEFEPENGPTAESEPENGPTPESEPENGPTPESEPENGPTSESEPENGPTVESEPEHEPTAESEPENRPTAESEPEHGPTAHSEPEHGPTAESEPENGPTAESEPENGPTDSEHTTFAEPENRVTDLEFTTYAESEDGPTTEFGTTASPFNDGCLNHNTYICSSEFGMNFTSYPNVFGQKDHYEALNQWYTWATSPSDSCRSLYSHTMCALLFPTCQNGTTQQICRQSCLDAFHILHFGVCSHHQISDNYNLVYYCNLLRDDDDCIKLPDYVGNNRTVTSQSTTSTTPRTTTYGTTKISHMDVLPTSNTTSGIQGIVEIVINEQFGYVYCYETTYCPSLVCQYLGYLAGSVAGSYSEYDIPKQNIQCSSTSKHLSDCTIYPATNYYVSGIRCVGAVQTSAIDCKFGWNNQGTCSYTVNNVGTGWSQQNYAFALYSYYGSVSSELISNMFTTPSSGSVFLNLTIEDHNVQLHVQLKTADMTYDLGYAEHGDTSACFDFQQYMVTWVAYVYEIKVNQHEICPKPFPYSICEFDKKCPWDIECSTRIADPIPFQWVWTGYNTSLSDNGIYLTADASFGRFGDKAKFTLPLNATTSSNLKLKYRNTGRRNDSSGSLEVYLNNNGETKQIFMKDHLDTYGSWESACVPMSQVTVGEIINGQLEFVATRGSSYADDIEVDDVELLGNDCPHFASCDFQSATFCRYTRLSESSFAWNWGTYNLMQSSSLGQYVPRVDHTEGTSSGKFLLDPVSGTVCTRVDHTEGTSSEYFQPEKNGDGCDSVFALDDVVISEGMCKENTGQYGDAYVNLGGHFMYVESSHGQPGDTTYLSFPSFTSNNPSSLYFSYHMLGDDIGTLDIMSKNTGTSTVTQLWTKTGQQDMAWVKGCVSLPPDTEQNIYFVATKASGFKGDIAVDNIFVMDGSCPETSVPCNFEDKTFLCGYRNNTNLLSDSGWTSVSYDSDNIAAAASSNTGRFLYCNSSTFQDGCSVLSPMLLVTEKSCISFDYFTKFMTGYNSSLSVYMMSYNFGNVLWTPAWSMRRESGAWSLGQFEYTGNLTEASLIINMQLGQAGIDNITIVPGDCQEISCPGQFSCGDYCIDLSKVCDLNFDCEDHSDETTLCDRSISCDFEDKFRCGYYSSNNIMESKQVIYQEWIYDHTYGNKTGTFYGMVSYAGSSFSFNSPAEEVTVPSCLLLHYIGHVNLFMFEVRYLDLGVIPRNRTSNSTSNSTMFADATLTTLSNVWKPAQRAIEPGRIEINFHLYDYVNDVKYFGIDDVTITPGDCPPLDDVTITPGDCPPLVCPTGLSPCHKDGICIKEKIECDKIPQCPSGEDEAECPISISCDFEQPYGCGYLFGNYIWRDAFVHHLPAVDHTMGADNHTGHYMFYTYDTTRTATMTSPPYLTTPGGCVKFYYNMEGGVSAELKVYTNKDGTRRLVFYANGIYVETDEWVEGSFELPAGETTIEFVAYGDTSFLAPAIVAIDDVTLIEGQSCPNPSCEDSINSFSCKSSGVCIPEFLVRDGYQDCLDGSDEILRTDTDDSSNSTRNSTHVLSVCTFEIETEPFCLFYNYQGQDNADWGEGQIAWDRGECQLDIKSSKSRYTDVFVILLSHKLYIQPAANLKIIFNGVDGNGYQGDIALDHIMLFSGECDNSTIINVSDDFNPSVHLVGGQTRASGRLEIKPTTLGVYSPVCANYWDEDDSKVTCRQLGYNNSRMHSKSEYGKGRTERTGFGYSFFCDGTEANLTECAHVAIDCSNTECFENEFSCGDSDSTCISEDLLCNGNVDCPNSADEQNCATCGSDEFECSNHECIPLMNRCDGVPQCSDKSDEYRCVKRQDNGQVSVYTDGAWTTLCYLNDQILAEYLCSITGYGPYSSYSAGVSITDGFLAQSASNPTGIITNYVLNPQMSCSALTLQCGDIECGVPSVSSTSVESYILFGNDAIPGEWPWQSLFFMDGSSGCGATLINPYYAITAAHCVESWTSYMIHVGEVKESEMLGASDDGQRLNVAQVTAHPDYRGSSNSYLSDIAIVRLSQPAYYNNYVRPACLATEVKESFENCYVTGWGYREDIDFAPVPDNLQEVRVDINVDVDRCNKSIQTNLGINVPATGICVENKNPYSPSCHGDSGGPLVCQNKYGRWELVGVTSFGKPYCRGDQIPAVYQSVPYHIDWIIQQTGIQINKANTPTPPPGPDQP